MLLLYQASVALNPPPPRHARDALAVAVSLTVGDIGLRDMQVILIDQCALSSNIEVGLGPLKTRGRLIIVGVRLIPEMQCIQLPCMCLM